MSPSDPTDPTDPPAVSVVMTVLNGARHLPESLGCISQQDYPGEIEVVVALGRGRDATSEVAHRFAAEDPRVVVVDNPDPDGSTPAGLNAALARARHPVVVRVDGHAMLPPDYVSTAVRVLQETGADNVGGVMAAEGRTPFEQAVARAMTTKLGVGNAPFHTGGQAGPADTVYLGGFDEAFARAQDWELNLRIRRTGGLVWFDPTLRVPYRPRSSPGALAKQYLNYGRWRRVIVRRSPETASARYLAPPVAVVALTAAVAASVLDRRALAVPASYALLLFGGGAVNSKGLPARAAAWLPAVYLVMHVAWGVGFLTSSRGLADAARTLPAAEQLT